MQEVYPIFDRAKLVDRTMGDVELARRIAGIFEKETPKILTSLQSCLDRGDIPGAKDLAHALKGSAANINGHAMSQVAYELELLGKAGDGVSMANLFLELREQFKLLAAALHRELM
jgi:HPt (histidine-containing phosphotransfer) domain-containing protein